MRLTYLTLMLALYCPLSYSVYLRCLPEDAPYLYGFSPALLHSSGGFLQLFRRPDMPEFLLDCREIPERGGDGGDKALRQM